MQRAIMSVFTVREIGCPVALWDEGVCKIC